MRHSLSMNGSAPKLRPATIHLWRGAFQSQSLVFAHLLDLGFDDLDRVEVLGAAEKARFRHFGVSNPPAGDGVFVLIASDFGDPAPFEDTEHMTYVGAYTGRRYV